MRQVEDVGKGGVESIGERAKALENKGQHDAKTEDSTLTYKYYIYLYFNFNLDLFFGNLKFKP